ncbi:MAG: hypothetical protein FD181_1611 [Prolixibacteraceae bacterium]|nr:MAG: hypothetical protein FD181_1611 [Prolixibacteraceae bacterium]
MEIFAKLIHKSFVTYLPTNFPAQFYGLPDGKVYIIYARFYEIKFQRSGLEFVLAEHQEFLFNYEEDKLIAFGNQDTKKPVYAELVDKPNPKIKILKVNREFNSFAEAFAQLNKKAKTQLEKKPDDIQIIPNKGNQDRLSIA